MLIDEVGIRDAVGVEEDEHVAASVSGTQVPGATGSESGPFLSNETDRKG
jgi:hypothetical protein